MLRNALVLVLGNSCTMLRENTFLFLVYHMPEKSLRLSSEFTVQTCETNAVASFEKHFLKNLESLVYNLGCEIKQWSTQCHASTDTLEKITHKLTFQFVGKVKSYYFCIILFLTIVCKKIP